MVALAALMALIPLNSSAQIVIVGCTIDGVAVPGDPVLIEGTSSGDHIDCSTSPIAHDIYGYGGDDEIYGSDYDGIGYDDFIAGGGGNDMIYGGDGDDLIDGGASDDDIWGEGGNDVIFGGVGASPASGVGCELFAAAGSSYLTKGGSGDDTIYGGTGEDCIDAGSGEDYVDGGDGDDRIEGGNHADILVGGPGADSLDGGWHTDTCVDDIDDDYNDIFFCEIIIDGLEDPDGEDPGDGGPNCDNKPPDHPKCSQAS